MKTDYRKNPRLKLDELKEIERRNRGNPDVARLLHHIRITEHLLEIAKTLQGT